MAKTTRAKSTQPTSGKRQTSPAADLRAEGRDRRNTVSRQQHAGWTAHNQRVDPYKLLDDSNHGRVKELIPIRYGRMLQSPFTFYRGAAAIMAADLAKTPASGIRVQACGDCHLLNFGAFATPERRIIFDINDFDETAPAPFEWDIKRLAASFVIAGRSNGYRPADSRDTALTCVRSYREAMSEFADMRALDVWYASLDIDTMLKSVDKDSQQRARKAVEKARARDVVEDDFPKMVEMAGGKHVIRDNPPLVYHLQDQQGAEFESIVKRALAKYRESLQEDRRVLLDRYEYCDVALKVVGVGSVGTRCGILLMMGRGDDVLFLQVKEARVSVLEPYAGKSPYQNRGQRVVTGAPDAIRERSVLGLDGGC